MFCDGCGQPMQPGQRFCSTCGKPAAVSAVPQSTVVAQTRVARHVHILGILWLVYSAFTFIGACVLYLLAMTIFGPWGHLHNSPDVPVAFLHLLFALLGTLALVKAFGSLAVGVGLLQRQSWARTLALVMAFLAMLNIPFGMALGIYTLWVLMSTNAADEYDKLSVTA